MPVTRSVRAGAHAALVTAAVDLRRQQHARVAAPHVERPDALRGVHLVCADRRYVDLEVDDVERHFADHLHSVGVEEDALSFSFAIVPISTIGWMMPVSLLAAMIVMRIVWSVIAAFSSSRLIRPSFCTGEVGDVVAVLFSSFLQVRR